MVVGGSQQETLFPVSSKGAKHIPYLRTLIAN
ncbi:unnamed protein product [Schistosoma margrebowiei]|uniref:Uncharacterized protein n=1 Tax=Schistosoma margrebowiei TaxID=48269 RepID=A0A183MD30_9TREM|nr:unnamed protein product [Schistosoma margrebowiei]